MARTVTVQIRKGGSGKTVTATNLAKGLSERGKKVLLIDLDPQANATTSFKIYEPEKNIAAVLDEGNPIKIGDAIIGVHGFDMVPGVLELTNIEKALMVEVNLNNYTILKDTLAEIKDQYDYIVIDNAPAESMLVYNSIIASDGYIIPAQTHPLAVGAIRQAEGVVEKARVLNKGIELLGILPTMYQQGTKTADSLIDTLVEHYGDKVLLPPIPQTIKVPESQYRGQTIIEFMPEHPASQAYLALADNIIKHYEGE